MSYVRAICLVLERMKERAVLTELHADEPRSITAAELLDNVGKARHALRTRGFRAGHRAVLVAPNSADWAAVDLAVAMEAGIFVPLYPRHTPAELAHMIRDSAPTVVICGDEITADLLQGREGIPEPILLGKLFGENGVHEPPRLRQPGAPATIFYTSGTSGTPRGVVLTDRNIEYMLGITTRAFANLLGMNVRDARTFHYLPFCFAGSRMMLLTCLQQGQPLMLSMELNRLQDELKEAAPHYFLNVPALLDRMVRGVESRILARPWAGALYRRARRAYHASGRQTVVDRIALWLAQCLLFARVRLQIGANLRCLICGSAPLSQETQRFFHMLGIPVYQVYGLTETTAIVTMDDPKLGVTVGRVGRPVEGCEVKVTERQELCVKGPNVFAGYWGKDVESQAAVDEDGWFHTGDQVELDAQQNLRIVGRIKDVLVPSSGHNIAPEPIESHLMAKLPLAHHVVVVGHAKPYLTAIVSGELSETEAEHGIAQANQDQPHYKCVRGVFVTRELFTSNNGLLTANQKLRRAAVEERFRQDIERLYA